MKNKHLLTGAVVVVAVLLVAPLLLPAGLFIPRIEKAASQALQDKVEVRDARLALLPLPHITLRDISVGKQPYLRVAKLTVTPKLMSLFGDRKALSTVELKEVTVWQPLLAKLEVLADAPAGREASFDIERIVLRQTDLHLKDVTLKGFDAEVRLQPGNQPSSVVIQHADRSLRLSLTPSGRNFSVALNASDWRLPAGPPLVLTDLQAQGELTATRLLLPTVRGRFYGGEISGQFGLTWAPDGQFAGQFDLTNVDLQPIAALYSKETAISGRLSAKGVIDMQAASIAALADAPNIGIDFNVANGTLHRMDLAAAVKLLPGREDGKPGQTKFDRFSGHLAIDPQGFHFTDLKIASGVLDAAGFVSISPSQELSGRIDTALKGTGSLVGTPLAVSGTVDSPKIRPTKGTLAGAAAGTLLLGPGVGTTIGMKAAELTERLFGKKPPKPKRNGVQPSKPAQSANGQTPEQKAAPAPPDPLSTSGRR